VASRSLNDTDTEHWVAVTSPWLLVPWMTKTQSTEWLSLHCGFSFLEWHRHGALSGGCRFTVASRSLNDTDTEHWVVAVTSPWLLVPWTSAGKFKQFSRTALNDISVSEIKFKQVILRVMVSLVRVSWSTTSTDLIVMRAVAAIAELLVYKWIIRTVIPFLVHIAYISVNIWSSSHVTCIVCLD